MANNQEQIHIDLTGDEPVITRVRVRRRRPLSEISSNEANQPNRRGRRGNRRATENIQPASANIARVVQPPNTEDFGLGIKRNNNWINHVKSFAAQNHITYWEALKNPKCKATYTKLKGKGLLDVLKNIGSTVGSSFQLGGVNPFDMGYTLGHDIIGPALLG